MTEKKPRRNKRRMTAAEFAAVRPLMNISEARKQAAYAALVEGRVLQLIADENKWHRQTVNDIVNIAFKFLQKYREAQEAELQSINAELPPDWEAMLIRAPKAVLRQFLELQEGLANAKPNNDDT